ncbi:MAG: biotin--[acetyl-CoA-carboxylase] ligase [Bacteroidales bacterium]|nr:biotin--[acetyl-CoA-carboxylase] ligase [Bacteroidales bacterium]
MKKEFHFSETLDSTNKEAQRQMAEYESSTMHVVYALQQTEGRGQGDHVWESEKDENVLMSILLKEQKIPFVHQFAISHATALAISDFVKEEAPDADVYIKWPNDILLNGKKCAGILVENASMGANITVIIAGIGLNLNQKDFSSDLPDATGLFLHDRRERSIEKSVQRIAELFDLNFEKVLTGEWSNLLQDYNARLWKRGAFCSFSGKNDLFKAKIIETELDGKILLELEDGSVQGVYHHEVRIKSAE